MMAFVERRLPPLQRVFLNLDGRPSAPQSTLRRSRSFSGYTSLELSEVNFELGSKPCIESLGEQQGPET